MHCGSQPPVYMAQKSNTNKPAVLPFCMQASSQAVPAISTAGAGWPQPPYQSGSILARVSAVPSTLMVATGAGHCHTMAMHAQIGFQQQQQAPLVPQQQQNVGQIDGYMHQHHPNHSYEQHQPVMLCRQGQEAPMQPQVQWQQVMQQRGYQQQQPQFAQLRWPQQLQHWDGTLPSTAAGAPLLCLLQSQGAVAAAASVPASQTVVGSLMAQGPSGVQTSGVFLQDQHQVCFMLCLVKSGHHT